ncbi:MAG TPA: DUF4433 domain-containing protein [Thermomicrobiales bacterium]|jgi:hypothetical protein
MPRKPDADHIEAFVDELAARLASGELVTSPWPECPRYLFHLTQIENVPSILRSRCLFSRNRLIELDLPMAENASPAIIEQTLPFIHDHVRLYFRPKTPTFARNEGIRATSEIWRGAHMPVPVAFILRAKPILCEQGVRFSDGGLARAKGFRIRSEAWFLKKLPFEVIYNDSPSALDQDVLTFHRQAEVIVPGELPLEGLIWRIGVRSSAEFDTLRTQLRDHLAEEADRWMRDVEVDPGTRWFFKRWTYVEWVKGFPDRLDLAFHASTQPQGFDVTWRFRDGASDVLSEGRTRLLAKGSYTFPLPLVVRNRPYRFTMYLDDHLAYDGTFDSSTAYSLIGRADPPV